MNEVIEKHQIDGFFCENLEEFFDQKNRKKTICRDKGDVVHFSLSNGDKFTAYYAENLYILNGCKVDNSLKINKINYIFDASDNTLKKS